MHGTQASFAPLKDGAARRTGTRRDRPGPPPLSDGEDGSRPWAAEGSEPDGPAPNDTKVKPLVAARGGASRTARRDPTPASMNGAGLPPGHGGLTSPWSHDGLTHGRTRAALRASFSNRLTQRRMHVRGKPNACGRAHASSRAAFPERPCATSQGAHAACGRWDPVSSRGVARVRDEGVMFSAARVDESPRESVTTRYPP